MALCSPLERLLQRSKNKSQVADQIEGEARLTKTRLKSGKPRQRITVEELQDSLDEQGEGLFTTNTARRFAWVLQLGQQRSTFVFLSQTKQRQSHKQCIQSVLAGQKVLF